MAEVALKLRRVPRNRTSCLEITSVIPGSEATPRWRGSFDLYDAYAFGQIYAGIQAGEIVLAPIFLGEVPSADAQLEKNKAKLAKLPLPFEAAIRCGSEDNDGYFSWTSTISAGCDELAPRQLPLEIGYTRPLTTLWHLHHEKGLARWPYEHDRIWLLLKQPSTGG